MIELGGLLASGTERDVYLHPLMNDRVIKIGRKASHVDRNAVEYEFYSNVDTAQFPQIPKSYGWVETSEGRGLEYELIAEKNGSPCCCLIEAVGSGGLSAEKGASLLDEFFSCALDDGLIVYDESLKNFLYQSHTSRLVLVDGFGPRVWSLKNHLRSKYPLFARKKIRQCRDASMRLWQEWLAKKT